MLKMTTGMHANSFHFRQCTKPPKNNELLAREVEGKSHPSMLKINRYLYRLWVSCLIMWNWTYVYCRRGS